MRIRLNPTLMKPMGDLFKEDGEPLDWLGPSTLSIPTPHISTYLT